VEPKIRQLTKEDIAQKYGHQVSVICHRFLLDQEQASEAAKVIYEEVLSDASNPLNKSNMLNYILRVTKRVLWKFADEDPVYSDSYLRRFLDLKEVLLPAGHKGDRVKYLMAGINECMNYALHLSEPEGRLCFIFGEILDFDPQDYANVFDFDEKSFRKAVVRARRKAYLILDDEWVEKWLENTGMDKEFVDKRSNPRKVNLYLEAELIHQSKNLKNLTE